MKENDWIFWILGAGVAYYFYTQYQAGLVPVSTVGVATEYAPVSNASGDQFSCPSGTKFTEIESQTSGSGYCE